MYAAPAVIKVVIEGIHGVSATTLEAAQSSGSNRWQIIRKVQLPMSRPHLLLAFNQGVIYVLAMVVVGGLVGAQGLGLVVVQGFSQITQAGAGLAAGIAIVLLGRDAGPDHPGGRSDPQERSDLRRTDLSGALRTTDSDPVRARATKEERVTMHRTRRARAAVLLAVAGLLVAACGGTKVNAGSSAGSSGGSHKPCTGNTNIAVNPWVGYEADYAVVKYVLENKLGCTVKGSNITEQVSWQGFGSGQIDVILENWGHEDLAKTYITDQKVAEDFGSAGNEGIIGWYVPEVDERPVPGHHRLAQPEQVLEHVQDGRVRQQGPAPGR